MAEVKIFSFKKSTYRAKLIDGEIPSCEIRKLSELPGGGAMMSDPVYIGFGGWEDDKYEGIDQHISLFKEGYNISAVNEDGFEDWDKWDHEQEISRLKNEGKWKPDKQVEAEAKNEIDSAIKIQKDLCTNENLPLFVPRDGRCFKCHRIVFIAYPDNKTKSNPHELVTGCPHCGQTFCD